MALVNEIVVGFSELEWETPSPGLRTKRRVRGGQRARLLELSEGFVEQEPCTRRHAFHVLEGACSLETPAGRLPLVKGDVGLIEGGEPHAHRLVLRPGERALLLVFDDA